MLHNLGRLIACFFMAFTATCAYAQGNANPAQAEWLEQQGNRFYQSRQYEAAFDSWRQALIMQQQLQGRAAEARLAGTIGLSYHEQRNYRNAINYMKPFLALTRELGERQAEGVAHTYLGSSYLFLNQYRQAADHYRPGLAIVREYGDTRGEGTILSGLGTADYNLGNYTRSMESYRQLLQVGRQLNDRQMQGAALLGMGNLHDALGNYPKSIEAHSEALALAQSTGDRQLEGRAYGGLGNGALSLEDYDEALENYQRSLSIAKTIGDSEGEGNALGNLGNVYALTGKRDKAINAREQSLSLARQSGYPQAELEALSGLGLSYERLGDYERAVAAYQRAYELARQTGGQPDAVRALTNLAGAQIETGRLADAETNLRAAVELSDALRQEELSDINRVAFFETQLVTYRQLQNTLIARDKLAEALEFAERGRAQALRVLLAKRLADDRGSRLLSNPLTLPQLQEVAKQRGATIVEYSVQEDGSGLFIWVVQADGQIRFRRSSLDAPLRDLVIASRDSIGARGVGNPARSGESADVKPADQPTDHLQRLHQILIDPIADLLPTEAEAPVVIVPHGELFLIPFAALRDDNDQYLIERHTLLSAPSIQVLALTRERRIKSQRTKLDDVLVVGDPTMPAVTIDDEPPIRLPQLPGTAREAREIAEIFGTRALTGDDATERAVSRMIPSARIVHLATHGLLDDFGSGIPGAIALAPSRPQDGMFTAVEISDLEINGELVVLSACDTGRGRLTGDGVIGLSRSLFAAGAPSVIVTLWKVPDDPTAMLMIEFYKQLRANANKAQALREAMLAVMEQHPNPNDWAAFTLLGEAE